MKNTTFLMFLLLFSVSSAAAQFASPLPVIETDMRDKSSVKLRSVELERVKRDSRKTKPEKPGRASVNNFLEIKADFEKIQRLETAVVTVYKTGKQIDYAQIAALSDEIRQSALRLKENLFPPQNKNSEASPDKSAAEKIPVSEDVKNLIVGLDQAIGAFVSNPMFLASKKVSSKEKEKAESDLAQIIGLSAALKQESEKRALK